MNPRENRLRVRFGLLLACLLPVVLLSACKTTSASGSKVSATTIIQGQSPARILTATKDVFASHGYTVLPATGLSLTFEKKGNAMDSLLYGNWTEGVYLRAKVTVVELNPEKCAIDCVATYVRGHNDGFIFMRESWVGVLREFLGRQMDAACVR